MEDLRKLEEYYDGVLQQITLHLINSYGAVEETDKEFNDRNYPKAFRIKLNEESIEIIIAIPYNYPDSFPKVVIPEPYFSELYPIPHLDAEQVLCTFDSDQAHPNAVDPIGVIKEIIHKAHQLIYTGKNKLNITEYMDEFESYWGQESTNQYLSLIKLTDDPKIIEAISFHHPSWGNQLLFADSRVDGQRWILQVGGKIYDKRKKALYLPLQSIGIPPFPRNNRELLQRLRSFSRDSLKTLLEFLDRDKRPSTIVFSIPYGNSKVIGVWEHGENILISTSAFKGKKKKKTGLKGFRPGSKNALLELTRDFGDLKLLKHTIKRVDKDYLFIRGGDGNVESGLRVGIVGCGSVGSHIARSLADIGVEEFLFVDKDILTFDNIARHVCGASDVGKKKVDALQKMITSHFPNCEVACYPEDILKLLVSYESILNNCDFSVVAVGHLPTEFRINKLIQEGIIEKPILFVWVEPYLAGAHAVWIDPIKNGCFQCLFDEQHRFIQSVLSNPGDFTKREAGCQSTFVPYGALELKRFINDLMLFLRDALSGKVQENTIFTWLGNLKEQRLNKRKISSMWVAADSYSVRIRTIRERTNCKGCSN